MQFLYIYLEENNGIFTPPPSPNYFRWEAAVLHSKELQQEMVGDMLEVCQATLCEHENNMAITIIYHSCVEDELVPYLDSK